MTEDGESAGAPEAVGTARVPREISWRDEGSVEPGRPIPILDSLRDDNSAVGEELRLLAARVQELRRERGLNCVALTSALPAEGKSTVTAGLAGALAREPGRRVLLVEADLRRPSLTKSLHLPPAAGLSEYLNGGPSEIPVRRIEPWGFFLVVAGVSAVKRSEALGSGRMTALLRAAKVLYDFVLLDAAPLLPVTDSVLIEDIVDGFLLVVRSRRTPKAAVDEAMAKLRPGSVLGLVLNDHREYRDSYRASAYRRYGAPESATDTDDRWYSSRLPIPKTSTGSRRSKDPQRRD
jgi:capsular exopolysaccharide synthesis family protein